MKLKKYVKDKLVSDEFEQLLERIPKSVGSFGYDPWGYNKDTVKIALSLFRPVYENYFRVEHQGLENIPADGRLLIIANHSGQIPFDGVLLGYALATSPYQPRATRVMVERWFSKMPYIGNAVNEIGAILGDPLNCKKMLEQEEAIIVFPEGVRGSGKGWQQRYQLQRFGLGFMHLAVETGTPIVPVGIVGCEEIYPSPVHLNGLARKFGLPYLPVTTPIPLPTKVRLHIGKPMVFSEPITHEDQAALNVEKVKGAIDSLIQTGLSQRKGWFS